MKRAVPVVRFFLPALLVLLSSFPVHGGSKSTVVKNARIYAFDSENTQFENGAMVFSSEGKILAIGAFDTLATEYPGADVVDAGGQTLLPGLIDSHGHLYGLAMSFTQADLVGTQGKSEVLSRLQEFAARLPEGAWLLGRGWDQNDWPEQVFPNRGDLDAAFPDRPVWLRRIDGHAGWANSTALGQVDRDLSGDWQVQGGHIHRDENGEPTVILIDKAMGMVNETVPETSEDLMASALDLATQRMISLGLTAVHDPGVNLKVIRMYQQKIAQGKLPVRVYAMADGANATLDWLCENGPLADPSGLLFLRSVKLYADGALGSRGAALLHDYHDEPGNQGLLFLDDETLETQLHKVFSCGLQAGIHAIGDRANRQVLDTYEKLIPKYPDNPGRHRVEHAQILHLDDVPRFRQLDVIAAMQPTHATSDMYWADERLGDVRLAGAYAWKSLLTSGALLAFGSDFPVERVDPMLGIHAAVSRQDAAGWPPGGWQPQERLSREAAIRAFTLDAAYSGFMEKETGSLEVGKQADFIILDRDIMKVPDEEILETKVVETWVGGRRVYSR